MTMLNTAISPDQLRPALDMARAYNHGWASVIGYGVAAYNESGTKEDIPLLSFANACEGGVKAIAAKLGEICDVFGGIVPQFEGEDIVHRTSGGTGHTSWRIDKDGDIEILIWTPGVNPEGEPILRALIEGHGQEMGAYPIKGASYAKRHLHRLFAALSAATDRQSALELVAPLWAGAIDA